VSDAVAVVVATRDRPALLATCLDAVARAVRPSDHVVVADSASRDPAVGEVATDAGATVVRCPRPGASRARNAGAGASDQPLLAFTDDDCEPQAGWAGAIAAAFEDPLVGFVTGAVVAGDDARVPVAVETGDFPRRFAGPADPIFVGHGANLAVRRAAFESVGGFDEVLGAGAPLHGAEDHDLVWRILAAGWHGRYVPAATVVHRQWRGTAESLRLQFRYGVGSGAFALKAVRTDGATGWGLLGRRLAAEGVVRAWRDLRAGYESGAAGTALRVAGVVAGAARGAVIPVEAGRYRRDW
jgi:GT2 family glycosyltransferase